MYCGTIDCNLGNPVRRILWKYCRDCITEFFGTTVTIDALWFMPLNDPMKLLVYSMLFGVIHLFVGLGIKGYLCLKDHKVMDFFCDVVLWFMLLVGLILMLLPSDILHLLHRRLCSHRHLICSPKDLRLQEQSELSSCREEAARIRDFGSRLEHMICIILPDG